MTGIDHYRGAEYERLFTAARRSLESTGGDLDRTIGVREPDDAERKAIIGLTGRNRPPGVQRITVALRDLDAAVRAGTGLSLTGLLERTGPPLADRPAEAAGRTAARTAAVRAAESSPLHESADWYRAWLDGLGGLLTRLVNQGEAARLTQAIAVLEFLENRPVDAAPIPLPALAEAVTDPLIADLA